MSRFTFNNFLKVIKEIELSEFQNENIWISVGILEVMYDDDRGYIDKYFHTEKKNRDAEKLWELLQGNIFLNEHKILT